jgi:hypothetical protein
MQKNPLVITSVVAALIAVAAAATLFVLSAYSGQRTGMHCPKPTAKALRAVADPAYGARLERLARCRP